MKEVAAKLLLIAVIVLGIGYFIYDHQWDNIDKVDKRATQAITDTNVITTP